MANANNFISLSSGDVLPLDISKEIFLDSNFDIQELIDVLHGENIAPRFRLYVLFPDETINYEIPSEHIKSGGSYSENYQDGQRRSLSFTLYNEEGDYTPTINRLWAGTRLRLDMGVQLPDNRIVWVEKGIFVINKLTPNETVSECEVSVSAADKFSLFEDKTGTLETSYEIPEGSDIQEVIKSILLTDMGNGNPLDSRPIVYNSSFKGKKTQVAISKSAGETLGSILTELATQLSAEIFYNNQGLLTLIPTNYTTQDVDKPLLFEIVTHDGDANNLSLDLDVSSIVNRVIVTGTSNSGGVFTATAVNDDPKSPLCYQRIGYRTGQIINDSNISSDVLAKERADYELRQQLILKSSNSITIVYNPLLTVNNLVAITDPHFMLDKERFLIQSTSYSLGYEGTMSVTVSNLRNLPFVVGADSEDGNRIDLTEEPNAKPQLAAPQNVSVANKTVSWDPVDNAETYSIYVDGEFYTTTRGE